MGRRLNYERVNRRERMKRADPPETYRLGGRLQTKPSKPKGPTGPQRKYLAELRRQAGEPKRDAPATKQEASQEIARLRAVVKGVALPDHSMRVRTIDTSAVAATTDCPDCGAAPGEPCTTPRGTRRENHLQRVVAYARPTRPNAARGERPVTT